MGRPALFFFYSAMEHPIAVIDYGSQYTQLIVRRIRELGYFSRLYQPTELRETGLSRCRDPFRWAALDAGG